MEEAPNTRKVNVGAIEAQVDNRVMASRRKATIDSRDWRPRAELRSGSTATGRFGFGVRASVASPSRCLMIDVVQPIAAAILDAGNEVVFAEGGSYVRNLVIVIGEIYLSRGGQACTGWTC